MRRVTEGRGFGLAVAAALVASTGWAETVTLQPTGDAGLDRTLANASLLVAAQREGRTDAQELMAAAHSDYARMLAALYEAGHYAPVIHILVDGREAAQIAPLDAPRAVNRVQITVQPGPPYTFTRAEVAPLAPGTELPPGFAVGEPALSGLVGDAARAGVEGWRDVGHAKAEVAGQDIVASYPDAGLAAGITLAPGPAVTFGQLLMKGYDRMIPRRLHKIAGLPEGERFSPDALAKTRARLLRTGVFSAVSLSEAETLGPGNTMDVTLTVVEQKPRRLGFGAEISSDEGGMLSAYWMHRNLLGGAERLRVDGKISRIGTAGGADYSAKARLERPATITADTTAFAEVSAGRESDDFFVNRTAEATLGFSHIFSDTLTGSAALGYQYSKLSFDDESYIFSIINLPLSLTWDKRDNSANAKRGFYLSGNVTPYYGLRDAGSGAQLKGDARAYVSFGADDRFTLAGRAQLGTVVGSGIDNTPFDYLFFGGGGGSVRGQEYRSLGYAAVTGEGYNTGTLSLAALSGEVRADITDTIGAVAFVDAARVSLDSLWAGDSAWHAGAGVGVRYRTPIGPIRLDIAHPIGGGYDSGSGVQAYVGIGQAF